MTLLIDLQRICPKNLKHIQLLDIMLQLKATSFAPFSLGAVYISAKSKFVSTPQIARFAVTSFKLHDSR